MQEASLFNVSQYGGLGEMHDTKFMTAKEKLKVLRGWEAFLQSGLKKDKFTKALYHHLMQHCEFIAHYDIHGFYSTYFESGDDTVQFLSQFDNRQGMPRSVEYGGTGWLTNGDYYDINIMMVRIAGKYIPALLEAARTSQKNHDLDLASALLAKHGKQIQ